MHLYFGLEFNEYVSFDRMKHDPKVVNANEFVNWLALRLGVDSQRHDEALQVERFRQLLEDDCAAHPQAFYEASFKADGIGTARLLLHMRQELLLGGWTFAANTGLVRLDDFARLEEEVQKSRVLTASFADRFCAVQAELAQVTEIELTQLDLSVPPKYLPPYWRSLIQRLQQLGVQLGIPTLEALEGQANDLRRFQAVVAGTVAPSEMQVEGDGSLVLLRAPRESEASYYVAQLLRKNPNWRPLCVLPNLPQTLDMSIQQEGLPALGLEAKSMARPLLQLLRLVETFLWEPVDPYKVLEFVSLPIAPLHKEIAQAIARAMAASPGLFSPKWRTNIARAFEQLEQRVEDGQLHKKELEEAQASYQFWFARNRSKRGNPVAREEVIRVFQFLQTWAEKQYEERSKRLKTDESLLLAFQSLTTQTEKIVRLLEALPEQERLITRLRLERIVRTLYEAASVKFREAEAKHLQFVQQADAILDPCDKILCWSFVRAEQAYRPSRWYPNERTYLAQQGVQLVSSALRIQRQNWQARIPILRAESQLVLVLPERIAGRATETHPLLSELEAAAGEKYDTLIYDIKNEQQRQLLQQHLTLPTRVAVAQQKRTASQAFLQLSETVDVSEVQEEHSFSSLERLFYYPHKWLLMYKAQLSNSTIYGVAHDKRMKGNLAHRFFELFLHEVKATTEALDKAWVAEFTHARLPQLLREEGSVLLMYGAEPERVAFGALLEKSAWRFLQLIQQNNWEIEGVEVPLEGQFAGRTVRGIADVVLRRGTERAVVDLKWSGKTYRKNSFKNQSDLQLVLYSRLVTSDTSWAHTAYFIIDSATLIARNQEAFMQAEAVSPDEDFRSIHESIWHQMEATYHFRVKQLKEGLLELRREESLQEIEDWLNEHLSIDQVHAMLELPREDAKFDDFNMLIKS